MAQKKSQVQNFEKAFDYTLFLGKYLPKFKSSSQNSISVDTLLVTYLIMKKKSDKVFFSSMQQQMSCLVSLKSKQKMSSEHRYQIKSFSWKLITAKPRGKRPHGKRTSLGSDFEQLSM